MEWVYTFNIIVKPNGSALSLINSTIFTQKVVSARANVRVQLSLLSLKNAQSVTILVMSVKIMTGQFVYLVMTHILIDNWMEPYANVNKGIQKLRSMFVRNAISKVASSVKYKISK